MSNHVCACLHVWFCVCGCACIDICISSIHVYVYHNQKISHFFNNPTCKEYRIPSRADRRCPSASSWGADTSPMCFITTNPWLSFFSFDFLPGKTVKPIHKHPAGLVTGPWIEQNIAFHHNGNEILKFQTVSKKMIVCLLTNNPSSVLGSKRSRVSCLPFSQNCRTACPQRCPST